MFKVAVWNLKGGTAKSTTALNLGAALATNKRKTVLIDLDGQRTLSFGLGMDGKTPTVLDWLEGNAESIDTPTQVKHLSLIPGDIGMFRLGSAEGFSLALNGLIGLNLAVMDCPPSLAPSSVQAVLASDRVLVPTLCEPAALKGLSEAVQLIKGENPETPIDVVRVRYKPRLVLTREADDLLIASAEDLGYRLLHTTIPENISVAESIAQQGPVSEYAPKSQGALSYRSLAKEVSKLWGMAK